MKTMAKAWVRASERAAQYLVDIAENPSMCYQARLMGFFFDSSASFIFS